MTKELSIENIKKELIDKLMNSVEVLKYLEADEWMKKFGVQIKDLYNNMFYDYGFNNGYENFVSVEVGEQEIWRYSDGTHTIYTITIILHTRIEYLDMIASTVKDIVSDLFPSRKEYKNQPYIFEKSFCGNVCNKYNCYSRMISFNVEK